MRTWKSKIPLECPSCQTLIAIGQDVRWTASLGGVAAVHAACPDPPSRPRKTSHGEHRGAHALLAEGEKIISRPSNSAADWYQVESTIYLPDQGEWVTVLEAGRQRADDTWRAFARVRLATDEEIANR